MHLPGSKTLLNQTFKIVKCFWCFCRSPLTLAQHTTEVELSLQETAIIHQGPLLSSQCASPVDSTLACVPGLLGHLLSKLLGCAQKQVRSLYWTLFPGRITVAMMKVPNKMQCILYMMLYCDEY